MAQDGLSNEEIAKRLGITRQTLQLWKKRPEFAARASELVAAMAEAVRGRGIAERENRVAALNDRWERLQGVIAARAKQMGDVPGGESGLLVRDVRLVKVFMAMAEGERRRGRGDAGTR